MRAWQPPQWQDKKRGGNYPYQWPPATWSNPHQEPGVVPSQPLTPLCGDMAGGRPVWCPQLGTWLAGDRQLFAGLLLP